MIPLGVAGLPLNCNLREVQKSLSQRIYLLNMSIDRTLFLGESCWALKSALLKYNDLLAGSALNMTSFLVETIKSSEEKVGAGMKGSETWVGKI